MSTLVIGLVVVGGAVVAVTAWVVGGAHQPATDHTGISRARLPRSSRGRSRYGTTAAEPARPTRWWQRLRSAVLLMMLALSLGILVATALGALAVGLVLVIRQALG